MGPVCRSKYGYDAPDAVTSWAHAFAAVGASCPSEVYDALVRARAWRDDTNGLTGARQIANALVKRLALVRSGVFADSLETRCSYVRALCALGYVKLAERIAHRGLGIEIALVDSASGSILISRAGKVRRSLATKYASVAEAVKACSAFYEIVLVDGRVVGPAPTAGDWFVDAGSGSGASVRAAYAGEERPGLLKVDAWTYFARTTTASVHTEAA